MKIRLGVVGPHDSIEIVKKAVKEFDEITLMIFPYERMEDIKTIIPQNKQFVDQWFFSGRALIILPCIISLLIVKKEVLYLKIAIVYLRLYLKRSCRRKKYLKALVWIPYIQQKN